MGASQDVTLWDETVAKAVSIDVDPDISTENDLFVRGRNWGWDEDGTVWRKLICDDSGRLITSAFTRPADTVDIGENFKDVVKKNDSKEYDYTIPNGKIWRLVRFGGGGYTSTGRITLLWDDVIVREIFVSSQSFETTIEEEYVGDGSKKITLKMENITNSNKEMFSYFTGWEK